MNNFTPLCERPATGNPYYNTISAGGKNPCITGKPQTAGLTVLCNCVGFAVGRFNEAAEQTDCSLLGSTNAENFIELAISQGLKVTTDPYIGGVMVWGVGKIGDGTDGAGHVAFVERKIQRSGKDVVITSESGYNHFAFKIRERTGKNWGQGTRYAYRGCIINPAVRPPVDRPNVTLRFGSIGDEVKWLQWHLNAVGYCCGEIDGVFGRKTRNAVGLFQRDRGLYVDHCVGRKTKDELQRGFYHE